MAKKKRGPGRPRLSETQKTKNKKMYAQIKKAYKKYGGGVNNYDYIGFKQNVLEYKTGHKGATVGGVDVSTKKMSTRSAIKKLVKSVEYTPVGSRLVKNAIKALKGKYPNVWEKVKKFCRDANGKIQSPEALMGWDSGMRAYSVVNGKGEKMGISFENSPEIVILTFASSNDDVAVAQEAYQANSGE